MKYLYAFKTIIDKKVFWCTSTMFFSDDAEAKTFLKSDEVKRLDYTGMNF